MFNDVFLLVDSCLKDKAKIDINIALWLKMENKYITIILTTENPEDIHVSTSIKSNIYLSKVIFCIWWDQQK